MTNETAVERRLREMSKRLERFDPIDALDIDASREAIALLKKYGEFGYCLEMWLADRAALLARCEGDQ
jgi:hypothetical protein